MRPSTSPPAEMFQQGVDHSTEQEEEALNNEEGDGSDNDNNRQGATTTTSTDAGLTTDALLLGMAYLHLSYD